MPFRHHALTASASALGYIAGNIPGAVTGYKLAQKFNKMPIRLRGGTKRKRTHTSVGYGGTKRRKYTGNYVAGGSSNSAKNSRRKGRASRRQGTNRSNADSSGYRKTYKKKRGTAKAMRLFKKILAPQVINSVTSGSIQSITARQVVGLMNLTNTNSGQVGDAYLLSQNDLREMSLVTGAFDPTTTIGGNGGSTTRRLWVQSVKTCITMKNMSNVPLTITLYDVQPRKDGGDNSGTASPYGGFNPVTSWSNGLADQAVTVNGPTQNGFAEQFPGATPYQSQRFCQMWQIKRKSKFMIHPGSNHKHYITLKPAYLMNAAGFSAQAWMRNLTTCVMVVVEGGVVHVTGTTPPALPITYSPGLLDYISETQYKFTAVEKSRTAFLQYSDLNTVTSNQATIVEDTDTVATYAQVA